MSKQKAPSTLHQILSTHFSFRITFAGPLGGDNSNINDIRIQGQNILRRAKNFTKTIIAHFYFSFDIVHNLIINFNNFTAQGKFLSDKKMQ